MSGRFFINSILGLHLVSASGGAMLGGWDTQHNPRYFLENKDDLYTESARGFIRGVYYPYNTLRCVPKVWSQETHPWSQD